MITFKKENIRIHNRDYYKYIRKILFIYSCSIQIDYLYLYNIILSHN